MIRRSRILLSNQKSLPKNAFRATSNTTEPLTFHSLFSDGNKLRVQKRLEKIRPMRDVRGKDKIPPKKAAVLVPLCTVDGVPSILFTLRSSNLSYGGQVSFPGGIHDDTDHDLVYTAMREADEELGLSPHHVDVWGEMTAVPGRDFSVMVTPVLGYIGPTDIESLKYNRSEVAEVFSRSIQSLSSPDNVRYTRYRATRDYTLPVYLGGVYRIWGLSAIILHMTLTALASPPLYTFRLEHR